MGFPSPLSPASAMRSAAFPPRPGRRLLRYLIPTGVILLCFYYLSGAGYSSSSSSFQHIPLDRLAGTKADALFHQTPNAHAADFAAAGPEQHPIDVLVKIADKDFAELLSRESRTLPDAAEAYRARRGRHPPPGFGDWYRFARERNALVVEDFWDQIYHDLEPFWAVPPGAIRKEARNFEMTIQVRNHNASAVSNWFWTQIWLDMVKTIEHLLPDMDIALNAMDEPRLVVPWEDMNEYMTEAAKTKGMDDARKVLTEFETLPVPSEQDRYNNNKNNRKKWEKTKPYWKIVRRGCPPESLARRADVQTNFNVTPTIASNLAGPHMFRGYVANYTLSTQLCHQPDLQGLNGIFVEPLSVASTKELFPMFGGSKLAVNNEILLPAPMYWQEDERFTGGGEHGVPWGRKRDGVVWRGVATGGRNRADNWRAFQRHRFVAMNNGTKLRRAEGWEELPVNFALPSSAYGLRAQEAGRLGAWVEGWANVSFVDLMCYPQKGLENGAGGDGNGADGSVEKDDGTCNYTSPHFAVTEGVRMADQFNYKYLPDIDGNSFSGRYLGFLKSTSLPVKATVWREWHDSRLVPWKHFVPMDNRYGDWYGIMEYFLGYEGSAGRGSAPGHDAVAERIANAGKEWADRVLRKEDMQVYVLRLLLEYARLADERREHMGWVQDLLAKEDAETIKKWAGRPSRGGR